MDLTLRLLAPSDANFMLEVENDPEVWSYSSLCDAPYTLQEIQSFCDEAPTVQTMHNESQLRFVVECDKESVGFIDLYDICEARASVAIIIYPIGLRHSGVGTMAMEYLCENICKELSIKKLVVEVDSSNTSSQKFFRKVAGRSSCVAINVVIC